MSQRLQRAANLLLTGRPAVIFGWRNSQLDMQTVYPTNLSCIAYLYPLFRLSGCIARNHFLRKIWRTCRYRFVVANSSVVYILFSVLFLCSGTDRSRLAFIISNHNHNYSVYFIQESQVLHLHYSERSKHRAKFITMVSLRTR